jgi:transcriptional regulator with XRE-family HTH domain
MVQGRKPNLKRWGQIARLRAQGLTYEAIGKLLGVSRQMVHQTICPPAHRRTVTCSECEGHGGIPRSGGAPLCLTCLRQPAKAALAKRGKTLRRVAGLSRPELARQAGLTLSTIRQAEIGGHWPHATTFERLAKALGVTVAVLTGEKPMPRNPKPNSNGRQ